MTEVSPQGLVAALARAQAEFPAIERNRENAHFKSKYADLGAVLAAVRPVLASNGIALMQSTEITEFGVELVTSLLCGEERLQSRWPLAVEGLNSQQIGSMLTYAKRYQLAAMLGVAPDDDDDGNSTQDVRQPASRRVVSQAASKAEPSDAQLKFLTKLYDTVVPGRDADFCEAVLGDKFLTGELNAAQASALIDALQKAKKGMWPKGWTGVAAPSGATGYPEGEEPF